MNQIRNTTSTDLAFVYDSYKGDLYINVADNTPTYITVGYIPKLTSVDDIVTDFWIDSTIRLATALAKVTVGRIRTRYTQSNALWANDVDILTEGNEELNALREYLQKNTQLICVVD